MYLAERYFAPRYFAPRYFGSGPVESSMYEIDIPCTLGGGAAKQHRTFVGEAFTLNGEVLDADGAAIDITGWNFAFRLKGIFDELHVDESDGFSITDAEAGQFEFSAPAALTQDLTGGRAYTWEIWRTDAGQEYVLAWGTWILRW